MKNKNEKQKIKIEKKEIKKKNEKQTKKWRTKKKAWDAKMEKQKIKNEKDKWLNSIELINLFGGWICVKKKQLVRPLLHTTVSCLLQTEAKTEFYNFSIEFYFTSIDKNLCKILTK